VVSPTGGGCCSLNPAEMRGALLDERLHSHGLSRDDLSRSIAAALDDLGVRSCFAYGSIVEGLANAGSDLDIGAVLSGSGEIAPISNRTLDLAGLDVDILFLPEAQLRELGAKLRTMPRRSLRENALVTTYPERRMAHAILNGVHLFGETEAADLMQIGKDILIAHLLRGARYWASNLQVDLNGMLQNRDWTCAIATAQEIGWRAADILLAARGRTNVNPKWRPALLRQLAPHAGDALLHLERASPAERFYALHRAPAIADHDGATRHAEALVDFLRRTMLQAMPGVADHLSEVERTLPGPGFPGLALDVTLERVEQGIALVSLGRKGEALILPLNQADALSLLGTAPGTLCPGEVIGQARKLVRLLAGTRLLRATD
jgi:hypothetical protein